MGWDWVSPAAGTVVAIAGLVGGSAITVSGRRHDEHLAAQRDEAARKTEHQRWFLQQRADAYIGLLDLAEEVGQ